MNTSAPKKDRVFKHYRASKRKHLNIPGLTIDLLKSFKELGQK